MDKLNKRARKRLRQEQASANAEQHFRFGLLAAEVLSEPGAFSDLGQDVVDVEVMPQFDGRPEDMAAWLIFRTREEAEVAEVSHVSELLESRAREMLAAREFPGDALLSFRLGFTSEPEIEEGGGRFYFFR